MGIPLGLTKVYLFNESGPHAILAATLHTLSPLAGR